MGHSLLLWNVEKTQNILVSFLYTYDIIYNLTVTLYFGRESSELNSKLMWHCHRFLFCFFCFYFLCFVEDVLFMFCFEDDVVHKLLHEFFFLFLWKGFFVFFLNLIWLLSVFLFSFGCQRRRLLESGQQTDGLDIHIYPNRFYILFSFKKAFSEIWFSLFHSKKIIFFLFL